MVGATGAVADFDASPPEDRPSIDRPRRPRPEAAQALRRARREGRRCLHRQGRTTRAWPQRSRRQCQRSASIGRTTRKKMPSTAQIRCKLTRVDAKPFHSPATLWTMSATTRGYAHQQGARHRARRRRTSRRVLRIWSSPRKTHDRAESPEQTAPPALLACEKALKKNA